MPGFSQFWEWPWQSGFDPAETRIGVVFGLGLIFYDPMTGADALKVFRETGALLEGHFILRSGLHSRQYFQCALALEQMPVVEQFGRALANILRRFEAQ